MALRQLAPGGVADGGPAPNSAPGWVSRNIFIHWAVCSSAVSPGSGEITVTNSDCGGARWLIVGGSFFNASPCGVTVGSSRLASVSAIHGQGTCTCRSPVLHLSTGMKHAPQRRRNPRAIPAHHSRKHKCRQHAQRPDWQSRSGHWLADTPEYEKESMYPSTLPAHPQPESRLEL